MSWCAICTVWGHPGDIQHQEHHPHLAHHWIALSVQKQPPCENFRGTQHVQYTVLIWHTGFMYLWEAGAVSWIAGCLCRTGLKAELQTSPATWWTTDMLLSPEVTSSESRCSPSLKDLVPYLQGTTSHCSLLQCKQCHKYNVCATRSQQLLPLFLFFRSVIGPHKTYTPAATAAAIPPMTPQFFIILFLKTTTTTTYSYQQNTARDQTWGEDS